MIKKIKGQVMTWSQILIHQNREQNKARTWSCSNNPNFLLHLCVGRDSYYDHFVKLAQILLFLPTVKTEIACIVCLLFGRFCLNWARQVRAVLVNWPWCRKRIWRWWRFHNQTVILQPWRWNRIWQPWRWKRIWQHWIWWKRIWQHWGWRIDWQPWRWQGNWCCGPEWRKD